MNTTIHNSRNIMNTTIHNSSNSMMPGDSIFVNTHAGLGYSFTDERASINLSKDKFLDLLSDHFNTKLFVGVFSLVEGGINIKSINESGDYIVVHIVAMLPSKQTNILKTFLRDNAYVPSRPEGEFSINIDHYYIDDTNNSIKCIEHFKSTTDFEKYESFMYPGIDIREMMQQYSDSDESLLLLSGPPGTGKTCVAKMMMMHHSLNLNEDLHVIYIKDSELLKRGEMWARIGNIKPDIIILDDLDDELCPRVDAPNPIISNMLSYSDGIFDVETKIIITTNLVDNKIDKALVRQGRCFEFLKIPAFTPEEALDVWITKFKLTEAEFIKVFSGYTSISQAAIMSEYQRILKSSTPTYLTNPSISIRGLIEEGQTT